MADPPWRYGKFNNGPSTTLAGFRGKEPQPLPYPTMTVKEIAALPVARLAEPSGCHLYLWTTNRYLRDAYAVCDAWGFRFAQLLVWAKTPGGRGMGGAFASNAEYVLFCRRGTLPANRRAGSVWFNWPRTMIHSKKPEAFFDLVEQVSPGPYLELFARRRRLNWDCWGNEVESTVDLAAD